jgi:hypothetical protein
MPVRDVRTGYDPRYSGLFNAAIGELRSEGLIRTAPARTGSGSEQHVAVVKERLPISRALINAYRRNVRLRPLRPDLVEFS